MTSRRAARLVLPALCLLGAVTFGALGAWQLERLRWKLDLIERVDARLALQRIPAPSRDDWTKLELRNLEYRPVRATGTFIHDRATLVQALTEHGMGYWVMTPLRTDGGIILVNRGFVPEDRRHAALRLDERVQVEGLLRLSEPGGRFLRPNRPVQDRWYSRDVAAIAKVRRLGEVAPFFIDAGAAQNDGGLPIGGLTVVRFRNAHLIYALTWFVLSGLSVFGLVLAIRAARRSILSGR